MNRPYISLDVRNNEIVIRGVRETTEFSNALNSDKRITFRQSDATFYVGIDKVDYLTKALQDYKGLFTFTENYKKFQAFLKEAPIVIDWYPNTCYIKGGRLPFHKIIPASSYFDKKFLHIEVYKRGKHSGLVHLFKLSDGSFPSGLLEDVIDALHSEDKLFTLNRHFEYPKPYLDISAVLPFTPTEDQVAAADALDKANYGIGKLPTGFGKTSFLSVELINRKKVRALFIANQRVLIDDARTDFHNAFGHCVEEIGIIGDGSFNPKDITVASIQGIIACLRPPTPAEISAEETKLRFAEFKLQSDETPTNKRAVSSLKTKIKKMRERVSKQKEIKEYLATVDMFIIDEGQALGTAMWDEFLQHCPAPYRYTITATDTRTDGGRVQLVAATGNRRYESSASEQIEKERLSEFLGRFKRFDHGVPKQLQKSLQLSYHAAYDIFIVNNRARNLYLISWLTKWANEGHSVLGLVTRVSHAENVMMLLEEQGYERGKHFEYVDGQTPKKFRRETIERFRNSEFPILLGTSIFDVGFNAKNASKMVRFNGGSSEVREPQRAGRTVRKRDDGEMGETIDILDINVPFFEGQGRERYKILSAEFGSNRTRIEQGTVKGDMQLAEIEEYVNNMDHSPEKIDMRNAINEFIRGEEVSENVDTNSVESMIDELMESPDLQGSFDFTDIKTFIKGE